tara:strand:+ start:341 stop:499 length:159 start_codon:yes stop_codon:yes gene_type:complete
MSESNFEGLLKAFFKLEEACSVMYEFNMKEKKRLDDLIMRIERLENEKNNPR